MSFAKVFPLLLLTSLQPLLTIAGSNSTIFFSDAITFLPRPARATPHSVPLAILRSLGEDFVGVLNQTGQNFRVITKNGEKILVDKNTQNPLNGTRGEKIVLKVGSKTKITSIGPPGEIPSSSSSSDSSGTFGVGKVIPVGRIGGVKSPEQPGYSLATCRPEEQTVALPVTFPPDVIHHPRCVRVERCGGCCGSDIVACEPTDMIMVDVPVQKFRYLPDIEKFNFTEQVHVPVPKHTKCQCRCRVKEEDCHKQVHEYVESQCACVCKDKEAQRRCETRGPLKVWDSVNCYCGCRNVRECSSGYYYDLEECSCLTLDRYQNRHHHHHNTRSQRQRQ